MLGKSLGILLLAVAIVHPSVGDEKTDQATEARVIESPFRLSRFDIDVTPPVGFPMAYDTVRRVEELGLRCRGIVLQGAGKPIVLCAVDWIGIANGAHDAFRETIAKAAGTTAERVAVHTLHQHDAPRCDFTAEQLLNQAGATNLGPLEGSLARTVLKRLAMAVKESLESATPVTHAAFGEAEVEKVASNRRIQDETGRVIATRYTACRDPKLRELPEGIIDPVLSTVAFYDEEKLVAVLSYYACHPQSYYRTGVPSPDFPGIARFMRGQDVPDVLFVHFNGAGGNIGAGKYNDGSPENRMILATRVADGMKRSLESAKKFPLTKGDVGWYTAPVALPLGKHLNVEELRTRIADWKIDEYWGAPEQLAFALRCQSGHTFDLGCLKIGDTRVLHMPGELFVEYQLAAKKLRPNLKVAMAAYADYGPGYIGTDESYGQGGYETSPKSSKVAKGVEQALMDGVKRMLDEADASVGDFSNELPRIPPTDPEDSVGKMQVADGFEVQLVASEPLIGSPVAIEWAADGKMFVCEMRGYSENRADDISTIALLTDSNQDGVYDHRTEFASGLKWPTALFPFDGGLFVGDAPHLYYMKDTDGDGRADTKKIVLTGFGHSNVQGLLNSMRWGLDNRIHVACSSNGGRIQVAEKKGQAISIRGRDLAFDPRSFEFVPTSGAAQHGMCFDDWGRKFNTSNSNHITQVVYEDHHLARNKFLRASSARVSIAADGPQAEVFRTSPVEPWRIVRTRLRVSGAVKGLIEGGGRASGYFTSATGITIYRGDAWPAEYRGMAIVGDVGSNLIHRKKLTAKGLLFTAVRIDDRTEFVTSPDIWFRPVQFANAPDGSLFVVDMYREFIEHPKSLPSDIKKHLDLNSGRERGRIYRIVPTGFRHRTVADLKRASNAELVALLEHDNAWHRETASRLLFERQDKSAESALKEIIRESPTSVARMHALYTLHGLDVLDAGMLKIALADTHPQVRRHAIRLAERTGLLADLGAELLGLADDAAVEVRAQLAFALGDWSDSRRTAALAKIVRQDVKDPWIRLATQSSLGESAGALFSELVDDRSFRSTSAQTFLTSLADQIVRRNDSSEIRDSLNALVSLPSGDGGFALPIIGQFLGASRRSESVIERLEKQGRLDDLKSKRDRMISVVRQSASDPERSLRKRVAAIQSLKYGDYGEVGELLSDLLGSRNPREIQLASLKVIDGFEGFGVAKALVEAWSDFSPQLRRAATEVVFSRTERITAMFDAVDRGNLSVSDLDPARLKLLAKSSRPAMARRASGFLKSREVGTRADVVAAYLDCLKMDGDSERGKDVFKTHCASCHRVDGAGFELGPNLVGMRNRGPEAILVNVLDPNREVNPEFLNYMLTTQSGKVITGMIVAEGANSVSLRRGEGATDTVLRSDIEELQSTRESIMPTGMEKLINKQAMSDLIAYLMSTSEDSALSGPVPAR